MKDFSLKDKDGVSHSLSQFAGKRVVLYFYPKDSTPGCTIEAREFSRDKANYDKARAVVVGISGGDEKSKTKFCDKYGLDVLLLSDPDFAVCRDWGVYRQKSFMGKKFMGIERCTFVLDENGKIVKVFEKVKPFGHSKEVLEFLTKK